jgi:Na+-transporting NADH:ubiquinone oxidoreductase subunit NqrC
MVSNRDMQIDGLAGCKLLSLGVMNHIFNWLRAYELELWKIH